MKLNFAPANSKLIKLQKKLGKKVYSFSLLSGYSCPGAKDCLSKAIQTKNGLRVKDGPDTQFRCFSASQEVLFKHVYKTRKENFDNIKKMLANGSFVDIFLAQLPKKCKVFRFHVAGDIFNQQYMDAIIAIAKARPDVTFYFYTKNLPVWISRLKEIGTGHKPGTIKNLVPTASVGGKYDELIAKHGLRFAKVIYYNKEARELKLPIDNDDSHAAKHGKSFLIKIHGIQPKNTIAAVAVELVKRENRRIALTLTA